MISYNKSENLLTLQKVVNPDMRERFNGLKPIRETYERFLSEELLPLMEVINDTIAGTGYKLNFYTTKVPGVRDEEPHVAVYAYVSTRSRDNAIKVIDLPYMDSLCKLHFYDGTCYSVSNRLSIADGISFDDSKQVLSIVLNKRVLNIECSSKKHNLQAVGLNKRKISLPMLITLLSRKEGKQKKIWETITNPQLKGAMLSAVNEDVPYVQYEMIDDDKDSGTLLSINLYESDSYLLHDVRAMLNEAVSIDRAEGRVLSRKVLDYPAGTLVTSSVLDKLKANKINCFYVKELSAEPKKKISGGITELGESTVVMYTRLEEGWNIGTYLRKHRPQLGGFTTVPSIQTFIEKTGCTRAEADKVYTLSEDVWCLDGKYAVLELLEFMRDTGYIGALLGNDRSPHPFEVEILGNNTFKVEGTNSWVYTGEITNYDPNRLNSDDLLALYSTLGFTLYNSGRNVFRNKDKDFLKKAEMVDSHMSKAIRTVLLRHITIYRKNIESFLRSDVRSRGGVEIFAQTSSALKSALYEGKYIEVPDTTNFVAEISQATHITSRVKEAVEEMRQIAAPYLGRLCLFETPEGKQVGLVCTKAMGCRIEGESMFIPVRKVIHLPDGRVRLSDAIDELSVIDEMQYLISDVLQLVEDENEPGCYKNTRVIAKVPNPNMEGERELYAYAYAENLDYVYAHTEQTISTATAMIPCASSDDAIRVSYGSKLIKSAIYILDPDKPCVATSMYRTIFDNSDAYLLRAEKSGQVIDIARGSITVMYDGDTDETTYNINEFKIVHGSVVFMRYKVGKEDRFEAGQVLVDSSFSSDGIYSPGKDELVAYIATGYNYEDAIHVAQQTALDLTSVKSTVVKKKHPKSTQLDTDHLYRYFPTGETVTTYTLTDSKGGKVEKPIITEHGSGIWYDYKNVCEDGAYTYKLSLLGYNILQTGDKLSGRHGNKGVDSIVSHNSEMPMLANGMFIRVALNPHGLPSRMNDGQVLEAHLGLIATVLGIRIESDSYNGATLEEVRLLMKMAYELANASNESEGRSIASKYGMPPDLIDVIDSHMPSIMEWANTFDEYGDARLWNPVTGEWFPFKVTIGVSHILKLEQEIETKKHERGGVLEESRYGQVDGQPPKGEARNGGQTYSEWEMWCMASYGAANVIHELCNEKSDNEGARANMLLKAMGSPRRVPDKYAHPRAVYNFLYQLESLGIKLECTNDELPDVSRRTAESFYTLDVLNALNSNEEEEPNTDKLMEDVRNKVFGGGTTDR